MIIFFFGQTKDNWNSEICKQKTGKKPLTQIQTH